MTPPRFAYRPIEAQAASATELAYLPITLSTANATLALHGLLDSGSTVNVLPYPIGGWRLDLCGSNRRFPSL